VTAFLSPILIPHISRTLEQASFPLGIHVGAHGIFSSTLSLLSYSRLEPYSHDLHHGLSTPTTRPNVSFYAFTKTDVLRPATYVPPSFDTTLSSNHDPAYYVDGNTASISRRHPHEETIFAIYFAVPTPRERSEDLHAKRLADHVVVTR
jgi:hypothetical protein